MHTVQRWMSVAAVVTLVTAIGGTSLNGSPEELATAPALADSYRLYAQVVDRAGISDALLDISMRDVAAIWDAHGLTTTWGRTAPADDAWDILVRVIFNDSDEAKDRWTRGRTLAWIPFVGGTEPLDTVHVSADVAAELMAESVWLLAKPEALQTQSIGRAIGRSVAHEIGHYLTATAAHSPSGLMRASFSQNELAHPNLARFHLSADEARRIDARLRQAKQACADVTSTGGKRVGGQITIAGPIASDDAASRRIIID